MTPLSTKLRRLAVDYPSKREELIKAADHLDETVNSYTDGKKLLGAWAYARRLYCDVTGEPLV
jgi:hypothetical protein